MVNKKKHLENKDTEQNSEKNSSSQRDHIKREEINQK
jgi:hypothetical protein